MSIRTILQTKGREVATVDPSASLESAAQLLAARKIGALVALGEAGNVIGILSERDVVKAIARDGAGALNATVSSVMTTTVTVSDEETTIDEAMEIMTRGRFRHLPVCENGTLLVGIVSIGDVVKRRIEAAEEEAEQMRTYIHAG
ncbi:CBS domain-containing protein [Aureimonas jatrophae]|jgi:CBS domain-containing protein|uniref:CBS domain-containing protein n=1 Tax=Aureimonas jatrophae TaxID=1166073 RepID=A0A1H0JMI0_9HYPH|nr:CBS domain-containing protein [Aureimonas jatrophae]MBB3951330.1 CBS domain-containing protein [Aureimonas jatrophae]SDO44916.1 CBS domain-containing protein [Aureimonas jatrophae]